MIDNKQINKNTINLMRGIMNFSSWILFILGCINIFKGNYDSGIREILFSLVLGNVNTGYQNKEKIKELEERVEEIEKS